MQTFNYTQQFSGLYKIKKTTNKKFIFLHVTYTDGSYVFDAVFASDDALEKPKNDLTLFCQPKGGNFKTIQYFHKDILSSYQTDPFQAYVASVQTLSNVKIHASAISRPLTSGEIHTIAAGEALKAENANRFSKLEFAKREYFAAIEHGSFGQFSCVKNESNQVLWRISIIPIAYSPGDQEHLIANSLYIGIKSIE